MIVFTSDNGGIPGSRARAGGHDSVGGLRGLKGHIHEGRHRVPFIVRWGDGTEAGSKVAPGSVSNQLFAVQDFVATIASLVGDALSYEQARDSFDYLPVLLGQRGDDSPVRDHLIMEADRDERGGTLRHFAIREGGWKLIMDPNGVPTELYDLQSDLSESTNLIGDPAQADRVVRMSTRLQELHAADRTAPVLGSP